MEKLAIGLTLVALLGSALFLAIAYYYSIISWDLRKDKVIPKFLKVRKEKRRNDRFGNNLSNAA